MAEDNKKALEMIQRLRMGIGKEAEIAKAPRKNKTPLLMEDLKIPTIDDIGAPTQSIEEMFALIQRHGHHSSGGVKADFTQAQASLPADSLKSVSDDLLVQMSPQQRENWQKLGDFIDNWVAENQAK